MSPKSFWYSQRRERAIISANKTMPAPYGLEIIESCMNCPHREERLFCNLPTASVQKLSSITSPASYPKGAMLFVEGQSPRGVFILCSGKVKLSTSSADGKTLILRISEIGEVLGLAAVVSGKPFRRRPKYSSRLKRISSVATSFWNFCVGMEKPRCASRNSWLKTTITP
jgi:cyclic nucleotide-binding protein